jgi:transketolase
MQVVMMNEDIKQEIQKIANTVKVLSIEAVQKANSGHPGMPLGCAEIGAFLFGRELRYNPKNPNWPGRDRLVLSAGHGSMWIYSLLHLAGYDLSLDELKSFRQLHSKTPGHPECYLTPGVEVTTGPLGQGVGNSVGIALGLKLLKNKFNTNEFPLFDQKVFCLAGDGCIMEGVSSEASSLAGHLNLNNLILLYDANNICLDGPISECLSEDVKERYKAYGWDVEELDPYDFDACETLFSRLRKEQEKPTLVVMHTIIGHGSPNKAGTHKAHGAPLGDEEVQLVKKGLGFPEEPFYIPHSVSSYFEAKQAKSKELEESWSDLLRQWSKAHPELFEEYQAMKEKKMPSHLEQGLAELEMKNPIAGRHASQAVIAHLAKQMPSIYGGSADLSCSDMTMMKEYPVIHPEDLSGRNIKFGVREFGMSTMINGLSKVGFFIPFCGTFLTFSDYMRNAIRLASLSHYHVIYQFTHDSIFLGEDGPTHQPIEHLASLRAMPNLHVIRPADAYEVKMAWLAALKYEGPTAIILTRQALPDLEVTHKPYDKGMAKGAYVIKDSSSPKVTLYATGSEVSVALEVAQRLEALSKPAKVVSFPCWELFDAQPKEYQQTIVGGDQGLRVSIEAACDFGWAKYIGLKGLSIAVDGFGHSAPIDDLRAEFGFNVDAILERIMTQLG